jgi:hypothetical protein
MRAVRIAARAGVRDAAVVAPSTRDIKLMMDPTPTDNDVHANGRLALAAKCAHAGCVCTVEAGERFCSEYCLVQAERTDDAALAADDDGCTCGHAECAKAARPVLAPPPVPDPTTE